MKKVLLAAIFAMFSQLCLHAGVTWSLLTDTGMSTPVDNVDFLIAADDETSFSVVLKDGSTFDNVSEVTFSAQDAIRSILTEAAGTVTATIQAGNTLRVAGLTPGSRMSIITVDGKVMTTATAAEGYTVIPVNSLPTGNYILSTPGCSFKFFKK